MLQSKYKEEKMTEVVKGSMVEQIKKIISKTISLNDLEVTENSALSADLYLNSLDIFEIFVNLETEFGIEIPFFMSKNVTIKELADYIEAAIKRRDIKNKLVFNKTAKHQI